MTSNNGLSATTPCVDVPDKDIHPNTSDYARSILANATHYLNKPFHPQLREQCEEVEIARRKAVIALLASQNRSEHILESLKRIRYEFQEYVEMQSTLQTPKDDWCPV
jgi:hypothetical protein